MPRQLALRTGSALGVGLTGALLWTAAAVAGPPPPAAGVAHADRDVREGYRDAAPRGRTANPSAPDQGTCSPSWLAQLGGPDRARRAPAAVPAAVGSRRSGIDGAVGPDADPGDHSAVSMDGPALKLLRRRPPSAPEPVSREAPDQSGPVIPNDPLFWCCQENLKLVNAPDAWATSYGGHDVTVAMISSGVALDHEDLASKLWRNEAEVPGNGVDDDGNGYVDDVVGWNFPDANGWPADFPLGQRGTMSAGIIGAATHNAVGVSGIAWKARLMPLKVLFPDGDGNPVGYPNDVTEAICYAALEGASVIFIEGWFIETYLTSEQIVRMDEAINYAHDVHGAVVVAPAGDCSHDADWCPEAPGDVDAPIYPAVFPRVIGVTSVSARTVEQNWNASRGFWVSLAAPGWDFHTTALDTESEKDGPYRAVTLRGVSEATSNFAAAHVAGALAAMRSVNPDYSPLQLEDVLCSTADRAYGGPYEWDGSREWNERMGCGLLDLEAAVETMQWKMRVQPKVVEILSDGSEVPGPSLAVSNPILNRGTWELLSDDAWVRADAPSQIIGRPATSVARFDLEVLREQTGGNLSAGDVFSPELRACALPSHQLDCTEVDVRLRIVEELSRAYLPRVLP